jgi:hypothetical protein
MKRLNPKKMINNSIREMQHDRLKIHQDKFKIYKEWMDICHIFYLMEDHELGSRISQCLEKLKNNKDSDDLDKVLAQSKIYQDLESISNISGNLILKRMGSLYENFHLILDDFSKNVLLKGDKNLNQIFINSINRIKRKATKSKNKMLKVLYSYKNPESFLEEYVERKIDFKFYI